MDKWSYYYMYMRLADHPSQGHKNVTFIIPVLVLKIHNQLWILYDFTAQVCWKRYKVVIPKFSFNNFLTRMAASLGMLVSPAKHSQVQLPETDRQMDRQTTDKVIPMCCYTSQETQKIWQHYHTKYTFFFFNETHLWGPLKLVSLTDSADLLTTRPNQCHFDAKTEKHDCTNMYVFNKYYMPSS